MQEVPAEIWLHISSFISDDELLKLVGVNIHFYEQALSLRYSTICIGAVNSRTDQLLRRLRDPVVASRVRRLVIRPTKPMVPVSWMSWTSNVTHWGQPSVQGTINALILVFPGLTGLRSLKVVSWDKSLDDGLKNLLDKVWSSFGPQLETISMAGRPESIRQFIGTNSRPSSCTALEFQFTDELDPEAMSAVAGIMVNSVAPFINNLSPQLQSLKIWSWSTLDLSNFFFALGSFPEMRDFHLHTPFNKAFPDPKGLTKFLEDTSLDTVQLLLNPAGSGMDRSYEHALADWFSSHASHEQVLSNLKTLWIYPTAFGNGFDALVMYLNRSADTLTTLAVKDRYLTLEEVGTLIAPVAHRSATDGLQSLRINTRTCSAELFVLLALKLPGLKSLSLYVGGSYLDRAATESFLATMQTYSFESWKLRDIGIWQAGSKVPSNTMHRLAECLPFVQSFWGSGHMLGEH